MPTGFGRITRLTKRADNSVAGNGDVAGANDQHTSDVASGLSDCDVIDISDVNGGIGAEAADPEAPYGRKADGTPRKRRGRQPRLDGGNGAETKSRASKKAKGSLGVEGLASIMANMTLMLAAATKVPEAALSNDETALISEAVENVAQFYDFSLNSKAVAWANLAMTAGGIIGAHVVAYKMRVDAERAHRM
jgi:hypothetical protein